MPSPRRRRRPVQQYQSPAKSSRFPRVSINPLVVLRLALPGEPPLRELAKAIGISHELLRQFEGGESMLSDEKLGLLAKTLRQSKDELVRRFYMVRLGYGEALVRDARRGLRELGHAPKRMGRPTGSRKHSP